MPLSQQQLDIQLDRNHTINVEISAEGPLDAASSAYDPIRNVEQTGFTFTPRQLLHAIGSKTAALPMNDKDESLRSAWLYTNILDLEGNHLSFIGDYGADLQTARSQEIGIGMMCLFAHKFYRIPWDQLGAIPGPGKRFDYQGVSGRHECIFEAKGTSHSGNQPGQIIDGLGKKSAHHSRGDSFDVELILSTFIGHKSGPPKLIVADPEMGSFRKQYERGDKRYHRLHHYCRVLQFVGLPKSAYLLRKYSYDYLTKRKSVYKTIIEEKQTAGYLKSILVDGDEFLGRWFDHWIPPQSKRYEKLSERVKKYEIGRSSSRRQVFQGLRRDIYESGLTEKPFAGDLLSIHDASAYSSYMDIGTSVFPDGTIMLVKQS